MGPTADGFYLLSDEADNFTITPGLLDDLPNGLLGLAGDDTVTGSDGSDTVNGNLGKDILFLGGGDDRVWGGQDNDAIAGEDGNDILNGNLGSDFVFGGAGSDTLRGGKEADVITGEAGDDWISGDLGSDVLIGGDGSDTLVVQTEASPDGQVEPDQILDFAPGVDTIGLPGGQTEADLLFENAPIDLSQEFFNLFSTAITQGAELPPGFEDLLTPEVIRQTYLQLYGVDVDPDGDGIVQGTGIVSQTNGLQVAYVFNVTPEDLAGQFVSLSDEDLAVG
jgi:Ca2+-binding RTX toxin-like protein